MIPTGDLYPVRYIGTLTIRTATSSCALPAQSSSLTRTHESTASHTASRSEAMIRWVSSNRYERWSGT